MDLATIDVGEGGCIRFEPGVGASIAMGNGAGACGNTVGNRIGSPIDGDGCAMTT